MNATDISTRVIQIIEKVSHDIESAQNDLTSLDAAIGDGDHGVSMTIAARAVRKRLASFAGQPVSRILSESGRAIQTEVGATVGALYGSALIQAGQTLEGIEAPTLEDMDRAFQAAFDTISSMGMAKPGEKTVIDAMSPAVHALHTSVQAGLPPSKAIDCAAQAAQKGAEATRDMISMRGRASRLGQRTLGAQDPGATSCYLILKSVAEHMKFQ